MSFLLELSEFIIIIINIYKLKTINYKYICMLYLLYFLDFKYLLYLHY